MNIAHDVPMVTLLPITVGLGSRSECRATCTTTLSWMLQLCPTVTLLTSPAEMTAARSALQPSGSEHHGSWLHEWPADSRWPRWPAGNSSRDAILTSHNCAIED